jgi:hypothetical protein
MEKNEMGGACSWYRGEKWIQGFGGGSLMEREHLEDQGIEGRVILQRIFRKWDEGHGLD